jgi:hypothetical protein
MKRDKDNVYTFESGDYPFFPAENITLTGLILRKRCRVYLKMRRTKEELLVKNLSDNYTIELHVGFPNAHKHRIILIKDISDKNLDWPEFSVNDDVLYEYGNYDIADGVSLVLSKTSELAITRLPNNLALFKLEFPNGTILTHEEKLSALRHFFAVKAILRVIKNSEKENELLNEEAVQ